MEKEIIVPKAGLTMTEATMGTWLVTEGDQVKKDQPILDLVTEKITVEVTSPANGKIVSIRKREGESVTVGECLGVLETGTSDATFSLVSEAEAVEAMSTTTKSMYDVAIIGGGPGGYVAAIRAAQLGGKVALIEQQHLGGVCLNDGCIPTKTLLRASELIKLARTASSFGIFFESPRVDFSQLMNHKEDVIHKLQSGISKLLKKNQVDVIQGKGKITGQNRIEIQLDDNKLESLEAKNIIVATGSRPNQPPIPGLMEAEPITSNEALNKIEFPRSIAIIGAGAIGCEFSAIYASFGVEVLLIESANHILPDTDPDVAKYLNQSLKKEGVRILTAAQVTQIKRHDNLKVLIVETADGVKEILVDEIMTATGRKPNLEALAELGVRIEGSKIQVDEQMRTNIPGIYAVGDVTGIECLAHVASAQGIIAAEASMGMASKMDYRTVSRCIYTSPEIASVGLSEREAEKQGYTFEIGKYHFQANGRALTYGDAAGFVKVLREKEYGQILGIHIIGPNASELISEAVMAIHLEVTTEEFALAIHPHPTLSEAILEAILSSMGRGIHS
jgi:dihydrolipoamide dehydrogenase